ncbi:MAG TPA: ROK family protein [Acidimicrobiales bacterium]|nr:ROK family protein [Acidimicrobiales bacterium]
MTDAVVASPGARTASAEAVGGSTAESEHPARPFTLAIDIGGTGLKAAVLDAGGALVADRVRVDTTYPSPPGALVDHLAALVAPLPDCDRVAAGFPGMVRAGRVLSAPHFVTVTGPGSAVDQALVEQWNGFDLAGALQARLGKPTRVANDADVQGAAVVQGRGLELVVTLGTGVGTAYFYKGQLMPHVELAQHPLHKDETYNDQLGEGARKKVGNAKWNKRVHRALDVLRALFFFDHCFLGGGNSRRVAGELPNDVTIVDNSAGLLGGIKLWTDGHIALEE